MTQAYTIPCPRCNGSGHCELTPRMAEAYALFLPGLRLQSYDVAMDLKITNENASMRLLDLVLAGLLEREQKGRYWLYRIKRKTKQSK